MAGSEKLGDDEKDDAASCQEEEEDDGNDDEWDNLSTGRTGTC